MILEFFRLLFSRSKSVRRSTRRFKSSFGSKSELLEARMMLAGDVFQNPQNAFDVNNDGMASPLDALVLSMLSSRRDTGSGEPLEIVASESVTAATASDFGADMFLDVNGDGAAGEADLNMLVDALNSGSGEPGDVVTFHVRTTDLDGNEITSVDVGDEFLITAFVQDTQDVEPIDGFGVFAAFLDVEYNSAIASVVGDIEFGSSYPNGQSGASATAGLLDEVGGFTGSLQPLGAGEVEVFSVRMLADAPGALSVTSNPADVPVSNDVLVFGSLDAVSDDDILYGSTTLNVEGSQNAQPDLVAFAKALADAGVELWTSTLDARGDVAEQLDLFEEGQHFLPINELLQKVEPENETLEPTQLATDEGRSTPNIWVFPDDSESNGELLSLEEIASRSGVAIPTGVDPSIAPLDDITVLNGAPLHIALDGYDPQGDVISYTVSVDNEAALEAVLLDGNRSIRFTNSEDGTYLGDMVFELFEGRASRATDRMIALAQDDFYDDISYHRVINEFVIQGGDPTGTGSGGSDLGDFDDQFHVDLQHTSTGILSMAKSNDDTNDSQFFVTEGTTRHLDFNHTVFGLLTEGERVRETISNVPVTGSTPDTPVTIEGTQVFGHTQNAVLMLSALESTGSTTVTVTATDVNGNETTETFTVTLDEDTDNGGPFLEDFGDQVFEPGEPVEFQVSAIDVEGDAIEFEAFINDNDATIEIDDDGNVTASGFIGTLDALIRVSPADDPLSSAVDSQFFSITINTDGPTGVDLVAESDSGSLDDDDVTNLTALQFEVSGVFDGATVIVSADGTEIGRGVATGETVVVSTNTQIIGEQDITAVVDFGDELSTPSPELTIEVDQTGPEAISNTAPTVVNVGEAYDFEAEHVEEFNISYSLGNAPDGMSINAATGEVTWQPTGSQTGVQNFQVVVTDIAGNATPTDVSVEVFAGTVELSLEAVDANGDLVSAVSSGVLFFLDVFVEDQRANASGIEDVSLNVVFDPSRASIDTNADIVVSDNFDDAQSTGTISATGVSGVGGSATSPAGDVRVLVATIPVIAGTPGFLDASVVSDLIVFGDGGTLDNADVDNLGVRINVLATGTELSAENDEFEILEDSGPHTFEVLNNDQLADDSQIIEIISLTNPTEGGSAEIGDTGRTIVYSPAADNEGVERFTYTIEDSQGNTSNATVTVNITAVNDPPSAFDRVYPDDLPTSTQDQRDTRDEIIALLVEDAGEVTLSLLGDETTETGELVSIISATSSVNAIRLISPTGLAVNTSIGYTPIPNFSGVDTITYTLQELQFDEAATGPTNGQTDTGTITVRIARQNDAPIARSNSFEIDPGQAITIPASDLLGNDSAGPLEDSEQTLSIIAVEGGAQGSVVLNADGSVTYTPQAGASGSDSFTYTIQDDGQSEEFVDGELVARDDFLTSAITVQVRFTDQPANAVPGAANDSRTVVNNGQAVTVDVLRNDSDDGGADGLSITEVTQGSNGSVAIENGQVVYTPAADFFGEDTFTYTISDGTFTDTAEVSVRLLDPSVTTNSQINGVAFYDIDGDGVQSINEPGNASVQVRLVGTDANGLDVDRLATTDLSGNYTFEGVSEGSYQVQQIQPLLLADGSESAGSTDATVAGDDTFAVDVSEVVVSEGNSFGDAGLSPRFIMLEMLSSQRQQEGFLTAVDASGQSQFVGTTSGWDGFASIRVELSTDSDEVTVIAVDDSGQEQRATVSTSDRSLIQLIGRDKDTDTTLLRIAAPASSFDLQSIA